MHVDPPAPEEASAQLFRDRLDPVRSRGEIDEGHSSMLHKAMNIEDSRQGVKRCYAYVIDSSITTLHTISFGFFFLFHK